MIHKAFPHGQTQSQMPESWKVHQVEPDPSQERQTHGGSLCRSTALHTGDTTVTHSKYTLPLVNI